MHPLFQAFANSLIQFACIAGTLFVAGWVIGWLARCINSVYSSFVWPRFGLYVFGLVGIPAHEFSHYIFCKIFRLKVNSVKWFDVKGRGGAHGAVVHSYDPGNPIHRFAHLFIGFAPILILPLLTAGLYLILIPNSNLAFKGFSFSWLNPGVLASAKTMLFVYLGFSLVAHMDLSKEDLKIAASGLPVLFFVLLLTNIGATLLGFDPTSVLKSFAHSAWQFCAPIMGICVALALLHLAVAWLVLGLIHLILRQPPVRVLP